MCKQKSSLHDNGGKKDKGNTFEIIIFVAYFGKLPAYYYAWERSALYNSSIDFYVFSDIEELQSKNNIHIERVEFNDFIMKLQSKFSFPIKCDYPYKICDYRPAFGDIFSDIIGRYDFWGYSDVDLVYGDIRDFVTDSVLEQYDRCFVNGHLSLYRNCDKLNKLYLSQGKYPEYNVEEAYSTNDACYFDEFRGMELKCLRNGVKTLSNKDIIVDIPCEARVFGGKEDVELYCWKNGKLKVVERKGRAREILYCHYQKRNMTCDRSVRDCDEFVIVPNAIMCLDHVEPTLYGIQLDTLYPLRIRFGKICNSMRKYGLKGTLLRKKRQRDVFEIRKKYE